MDNAGHEARSLSDYLRVVRRRKWLIVSVVALFTLAALAYSLNRSPLYRASSEVLINRTSSVAQITGSVEPVSGPQPDRVAQTEASVAAVPAVAQRVLEAAGVTDMTVEEFLAHSSATAKPDADLIVLSVEAGDPGRAALLASEYAQQFKAYRKELDTAAIQQALLHLQTQIDALRDDPQRNNAFYADLQAKAQQLQTAEALATGNTSVIRKPMAAEATKIRPRPVRDAFLAAGVGLLLGVVLAFFRDAIDTRIRSSEEIGERLGVPLLARIPEPPRPFQMNDRLVMFEQPNGAEAESFRMLRTNLDFINLERQARTIMITSASEREGKSTTVANLAIALARAGKSVVLVDLDLRRPFLDTVFDLEGKPGLTHVAVNAVPLDQALFKVWAASTNGQDPAPAQATRSKSSRQREVRVNRQRGDDDPAMEHNGRAPLAGLLEVMTAGTRPPNPGEFVSTRAVGNVLEQLRERADFVLVDAPPLLGVGDAMTLSARVDGVVIVTRMNMLTRPQLGEVHRLLATSPAETLGFVITGADAEVDQYGYGYGSDGYQTGSPQSEGRRRESRASQPRARERGGRGRASRASS